MAGSSSVGERRGLERRVVSARSAATRARIGMLFNAGPVSVSHLRDIEIIQPRHTSPLYSSIVNRI